MKMFQFLLTLSAVFILAAPLFGQKDIQAQDIQAQSRLVQDEKIREDIVDMIGTMGRSNLIVDFYGNSFMTAEDGRYAAQNKEELQTYYDLGMSYQYIESPEIRKQLGLQEGEGIIIEATKEDGEGFEVGFRPGDLVLNVEQEPVDTQYDLVIALTEKRGKPTGVELKREGQVIDLAFELSALDQQAKKRWAIGISAGELSDLVRAHLNTEGVVITNISEGGPAQKMAMQVNDIIFKINDAKVTSPEELRKAIQNSVGNTIKIELFRNGNKMTVELKPEVQKLDVVNFQIIPPDLAIQNLPVGSTEYLNFVPDRYELKRNINLPVGNTENDPRNKQLEKISQQLESLQLQIKELRELLDK